MLEAYAYPSHVHALSFVSIKLSGNTNYREWQEQMMCLVDSHDMMGFIDGTLKESQDITNDFEKKAKYREWKRSDTLVKGWIFGSLSEGVMRNVVGLNTANEVWDNLKTTYSTPSTPDNIEMQEEWHYPSHVNVANFVSIKLEGETNFLEWKAQMTCLLKGHDMLGFVDGTLLDPTHKGDIMSDTVVKGWIFGSLSESVMGGVVGLDTSIEVWNELKTRYGPPDYHNKEDTTRYLPLYRAILRSDWEEVGEIVNNDKDALTAKLDPEGYSPLHLAIHECKDIEFIESLLKQISPESLPTMLTHNNYNPLHIAAMVGNTEAAKLLVEKNPHSLFILDEDYNLPIGVAVMNPYITTFQYLLEACKQHIGISQQYGDFARPFEGRGGAILLALVIDAGLVDVACELINKYPDMAESYYGVHLVSIAKNWDLYYSGTNYNFYQTFLYTHVPIEIDVNLDDTNNIIQDIENQDKCNRKSVTNRRRRFFYYVIQKIYAKFWNAVLLRVAHVKHLQEEKVKHKKALILLKFICQKVCKSDEEIDISEHYGEAFHLAVQNGTYDAVQEIMGYFPKAIWAKKNDYFATQIAIKDRCLEVHNVLLRYLGRDKYLVKMSHDRDGNNRLHLAAQLAPIPKLNLVSGAALQMQRELQWFKGVENFDMPHFKEALNKNGETPIMVFRREHMELRKDGESWMKKTADSYTITAALIITIVFAAAITIPGGNDNSGKANYATKPSFFIFIISDAISLFTSTTSLLLFLSILTARYLEEDFLYRLPLRLILGLGMLFVSVTSMMVAFSATLYLTFGHGRAWIMYPVAVLACLPIASFVTLQLPLLFELVKSTYYNRVFSKHRFPKIK